MPSLFSGNGSGSGLFGMGGGISNATFSDLGGGISDLFAAEGDRAKAQGDLLEKQNYLLASDLATQNAQYTELSTNIKTAQIARENTKVLGEQTADIASAGFANSGSSLDLMAESARQGEVTKQVAVQQGYITEQGYKEQAQSYQTMAQAAQVAADAENKAAEGADITGIIKGVASVATLF